MVNFTYQIWVLLLAKEINKQIKIDKKIISQNVQNGEKNVNVNHAICET